MNSKRGTSASELGWRCSGIRTLSEACLEPSHSGSAASVIGSNAVNTESLEALEAVLAVSPDRETLAVYADHLQALGDPRGELLAIDLEIERTGATDELVTHRTSILHAWLGRHEPSDPRHRWIGESLRLGFVEDLVLQDIWTNRLHEIHDALATPLAPYIRGITIMGKIATVARALGALATTVHHHLTRLTIRCQSAQSLEQVCSLTGDGDEAIAHIFGRFPRLQLLELRGGSIFAQMPHAGVRRLRITGFDAITSLVDGEGPPLSGVEALDFAFDDGDDSDRLNVPNTNPSSTFLSPAKLPALRRLDLSRNEAEVVNSSRQYEFDLFGLSDDPDSLDLFTWLRALPIRSQLTHLRVPSIRSDADRRALEHALQDMPELVEFDVARPPS